jgi:hypothetical protein
MLILDKPYVSEKLAMTAASVQIPVLRVGNVEVPFSNHIVFYEEKEFFRVLQARNGKILLNSENAIGLLERHLPSDSRYLTFLRSFKNKGQFRVLLKRLYPHFYYEMIPYEELLSKNVSHLHFPVVLKPAVGYGSVGVYRIESEQDWYASIELIRQDVEAAKDAYLGDVVDTQMFVIEQWIDGEEYALDAYFTETGKPVILNVMKRAFASENDTSDGVYFTSKKVLQEALAVGHELLQQIHGLIPSNNFPLHMEFRITSSGDCVPIEINPFRFAGIGTADLAFYAYGINPYLSYFTNMSPDWDEIMSSLDDHVYGFYCAELPVRSRMYGELNIDEASFKQEFPSILEYRSLTRIDPTTLAVVFYKTPNEPENDRLARLDISKYVKSRVLL